MNTLNYLHEGIGAMADVKIGRLRLILLELSQGARVKKLLAYKIDQEVSQYVFNDPFAFFAGVLANQQGTKAGGAWRLPYVLSMRMGSFTPKVVASMSGDEFENFMRRPQPLHSYSRLIGRYIRTAAIDICECYGGRTENIWNTTSVYEVGRRISSFLGIGPKKKAMMLKMLYRDWGWKADDPSLIPLAPDRHVGRILIRAGLMKEFSLSEIDRVGRALNPQYPAALDDALWLVGNEYCHATNPICGRCLLRPVCIKDNILSTRKLELRSH